MQLAVLLAVLAALTSPSGDSPVAGAAWRILLTGVASLLAPLLAGVGGMSLVRRMDLGVAVIERSYSRLQSAATWAWLVTSLAILFALQWPEIVRVNAGLANWVLLDELVILAPILAPLPLIWTCFYWVERTGRARWSCPNAVAQQPSLLTYLGMQLRHDLALTLIPALVMVLGGDLLERWSPHLHPATFSWIAIPLLIGSPAALPLLLKRIWKTTPLPAGPLRERLVFVAAEMQTPLRELLLWHTEGLIANAAVAGISGRFRYVFLTDALLDRLSDDQLVAVLRHELGHVRRRHLLLRLLLLTLPLAIFLAASTWMPTAVKAAGMAAASRNAPDWQTAAFALLLGGGFAIFGVGGYSKRLEYEADMEAITCGGEQVDSAAALDFYSALASLRGSGEESWLARWLHPPVSSRLALIGRAISDPAVPLRLRRWNNYLATALFAAWTIAALVALAGLLLRWLG